MAKLSNKLDDMTATPVDVTVTHKSHLHQRENTQIRLQVVSVEQPCSLHQAPIVERGVGSL